ncbi:MAG: hypothetical protein HY904_18015 [Deltaproteobacteria bacterium]|nr:hypothetical protein [Deltaproteobacteria bacterium]
MRVSLSRVLAAAAVFALGLAAPAHATVVVQSSLEEMTQKSDVVVHAVVEEVTVTTGEGGRILTLSRLRVKDGLKGKAGAGDTLALYQVGGTHQGRVANIVGVSRFHVGEEVVLFADTFIATETIRYLQQEKKAEVPSATLNPTAGWVVTYGIGLGKFAVERGGSVPQAVEEVGDVVVVTPGRGMSVLGQPSLTRQPLDVFKTEVRRMAAAGRVP